MNDLYYLICEGLKITAAGFRSVDKELNKQKKFNRNVVLLSTAMTVYICTNEIRARYQEEEIRKLKKKVKEIEKG